MRFGISGHPIPAGLPYAAEITTACAAEDMPPCLLYALAWRESIQGEVNGSWNAATVVSADGGHGLFQLTSSYPSNWADPTHNAAYAIADFVSPTIDYWNGIHKFTGETLVLLVAATFNEGLGAAIRYHAEGDVDAGTTNEYGHGVLAIYRTLISGQKP